MVNALDVLCYLCGHAFRFHNTTENLKLWWCDVGNCGCDDFIPTKATGKDGDEIQVPYDSDSFRWN